MRDLHGPSKKAVASDRHAPQLSPPSRATPPPAHVVGVWMVGCGLWTVMVVVVDGGAPQLVRVAHAVNV